MVHHEAEKLIAVIARIIELRSTAVCISPTWVATEALIVIDEKKLSPPLVSLGCHLQLRQIARGLLRKRYEDDDEDSDQDDLFPELQARYPTARSRHLEEPEYILREKMSDEDINYNVHRLRQEAEAKLSHADALEAYGRTRKRAA